MEEDHGYHNHCPEAELCPVEMPSEMLLTAKCADIKWSDGLLGLVPSSSLPAPWAGLTQCTSV